MRLAGIAAATTLCSGAVEQSALHPAGLQAQRIGTLGHFFFWGATAVYCVTMLVILAAVFRRYRPASVVDAPDPSPPAAEERRLAWWVGVSLVLTTLVLFALLMGDFITGRRIHALADTTALQIRVTGKQWWWQVEYLDKDPSKQFGGANEIHLPVGQTAEIDLVSNDVIHSFWVPSLHGKRDLIPGHPTKIYIRADRPGTFAGQCAEYCGLEHAFMRLIVTAEPPQQFQQ
jgi:cytochrome c oxidase subunit 2